MLLRDGSGTNQDENSSARLSLLELTVTVVSLAFDIDVLVECVP